MSMLGPPSSRKAALAIMACYIVCILGGGYIARRLGYPDTWGILVGLALSVVCSVALRWYWPRANHGSA